MQHLKYIAHITRLPNNTYQKQFLFSLERKQFSRNKWLKIEKQLGISTTQRHEYVKGNYDDDDKQIATCGPNSIPTNILKNNILNLSEPLEIIFFICL